MGRLGEFWSLIQFNADLNHEAELINPKGYNIGINQGSFAGGSIDHLHIHIVPRYDAELGFIDIVGKTRVLPEGLDSVKKKLTQNVTKFLNKEFFENFR